MLDQSKKVGDFLSWAAVLSLVMFASFVAFLIGFAVGFAISPNDEVKDV